MADHHQHSDHGSVSPAGDARRSMPRELWRLVIKHPIRNVSVLILLGASVVGLATGMKYLAPKPAAIGPPTKDLLDKALAELDAGNLDQARNIAADLRLKSDIPKVDLGIPPYVLGLVMHHEASTEWQDRERRALHLLAARYLEESRQAGFPQGRAGLGEFVLGQSLHGSGRGANALPHLLMALEQYPTKATEACRLLTEIYLRDKTPNLEKASEFNQRFVADPTLSLEDRDAARLIQADILYRMKRFDECRQTLAAYADNSPQISEVLLLRGQLLFGDADQLLAKASDDPQANAAITDKLNKARELFLEAVARSPKNGDVIRKSQYLQGLCLRRLGDYIAAENLFQRTRRSFVDSPEGVAAALEEAELQHLLGNDTEAVQAYRRMLRMAADRPQDLPVWVSETELRQRLEATLDEFRKDKQFALSVDFHTPVAAHFGDARSAEQLARLHQSWAEHLTRQANQPNVADPAALRTQARLQHRQAGNEFARLAKLRFATRAYPNDLWQSAENYRLGQDYETAELIYRKHLDQISRADRPPTLTQISDCLLAMNQPAEALAAATECLEFFPKHPFVYRARVIAAEAQLELGHAQQAKELLLINLENDSLTPQSREWQDSLYALGRLHYLDGTRFEAQSRLVGVDNPTATPTQRQAGFKELEAAQTEFRECIRRLSEAIQRRPDAEQAIEARFLLAMAHVQSAKVPKRRLTSITIETTRVTLRRELQGTLQSAAQEFEALKTQLIARQEHSPLTPVEARILRNCYFSKADVLFDLDQFEEAIQAYTSATNRYQVEPESIEAYVQIAICQRKLNRSADSRRTLEQAKLVLGRMPQSARFTTTTRYDRQEWSDLLTWLSSL